MLQYRNDRETIATVDVLKVHHQSANFLKANDKRELIVGYTYKSYKK